MNGAEPYVGQDEHYETKIVLNSNLMIQWNLDLRKPDLRKIVGKTDFLVHKLFDLRKIFFQKVEKRGTFW